LTTLEAFAHTFRKVARGIGVDVAESCDKHDPMNHRSDYHDRLLADLLAQVFGTLDAHALALLRDHLRWVAIAGGQTLMAEGEPGDSMYVSVSGRLRAYVKGDNGTPRMVREMSRGQVIGEMSLFTGEPRSATVVAIRDSVLVRLDKQAFDRLIAASSQVSVALTRQIIQRLKTEHQTAAYAAPVTVGLLPVTAGRADAPALARALAAQLERFGSVCSVDASALQALPGEDAADTHRRVALALDELESRHAFVLLVADDAPTPWTQLCSRHCDELLLLADATQPVAVSEVERACLRERPPPTEASETLVLLHDEALRCPSGTGAWLERRAVSDHVHVRPALERDMARLARLLARQAVGLVLAGGGARGFAHLGVMQALEEAGIAIDCVGGTSMGAAMALVAAADQGAVRAREVVRAAFKINPTGDFNLLPMISLIRGGRVKAILERSVHEIFGGARDIEDLWKSYFCVAANYTQAREEVLTRGDAQTAVRASMAIPGALPPVVRAGDLLCDGGSFNNFPVDVMRARRGIGRVIGVDLSARKPRPLAFAEVPGSWALLRDRLRPRATRRYKLPTLASYLLNVTVLYSQSREQAATRQVDLLIKPPLERVGLLQWDRLDAIARQGYEHAREVLAAAPGA
jgi:NTE family protein